MERGKTANFGVTNTNDKNVTFKISFSSEESLCHQT